MNKIYVQYGCGLCAPDNWINFDASPTLRIQKIPLLGKLLRRQLNVIFPNNVQYGNIEKGLPIQDNTCDGIYCSHVLEHFSLNAFRRVIRNTYKMLKGSRTGIFRCVLPDLEQMARKYINELDTGNVTANYDFIKSIHTGCKEERTQGLKAALHFIFGSIHLWMWDAKSLHKELTDTGFVNIRQCSFNDCEDEMFKSVESEERFKNAIAFECKK
ncbi:MAG: methyltransferase domain-containing protein [Planctomycetaceae bacterium]|jgi:SAM-dependent methyltransferase|nr:methyltransferase domain-containing protein [Planctomycetaceae bacterium]